MNRLAYFGLVSAVVFAAETVHAQDSLRVLRLQPVSPAAPTEQVVITFDRPVAPRLDVSVDPTKALRISPAVRAHIYWRDPSTIIAVFAAPWAAGTHYELHLDPTLRSQDGLPLESRLPLAVTVRMPRMLQIFPDASKDRADTVARPVALFDEDFDLSLIASRVWFIPQKNCGITDSVALRAVRSRRISDSLDSYGVQMAGGYDRDRRLDSLRRVVEFELPATLNRGCQGELRLPQIVGQPGIHRAALAVRPPFRLDESICADGSSASRRFDEDTSRQSHCNRGPITLRFTEAVTAAEVRAHVRVNGRPARFDGDEASTAFALLDSIQPKRTARIVVRRALRSIHGERLGYDTTMVVVGNRVSPSVGYATGQVLVPRDAATLIRVRHINTDSVIVVIGRVADSQRSIVLKHMDSHYDPVRWEGLRRDTVARVIRTIAKADREGITDVPVSLIPREWRDDPILLVRAMPFGGSGSIDDDFDVRPSRTKRERAPITIHAVILSNPTQRYAVVRRSNIAAHVLTTAGNVDVWVTSLHSALPRPGAIVRLLDDSMHTHAHAVTNAAGRATLRFSLARATQFHIEAAEGNDRALLLETMRGRGSVVDEDSLDGRWWFVTSAKLDDGWLHGTAFTERGIYRPGERVYLGGAMRIFSADSGYRTPASDSARWTVWYQDPEGRAERVWSHAGQLSDFGTLPDSFQLARTARLGTYAASFALRANGGWRSAARVEFSVAEYRAPEFAVHLDTDTTRRLFGGDTARLRVDARYLFGLPMAGGAVRWWWSQGEGESSPPVRVLDGYTVGRYAWRLAEEGAEVSQKTHDGNDVLAPDGTFTLSMPTHALSRPGSLQANVTITDASRQTVTSQLSIPLHGADAYVGMRTRERRWVWRTRDTIAAEILVARPDGTVRVGDQVTLVVQRSRWLTNRIVRDTVWREIMRSGAAPVIARFVPRAGGSYELIASVVDERGRRASTGLDVWVTGGNEKWAQRDPRVLTLRADKTIYKPGEQVSLIVESAADQHAWVTLRREGILHEQFVDLHAGVNEVRVPVPVAAASGADIRVIAVRPYGARGNDSTGIYYRAGSYWIKVDTTARSLHLSVAPDRERYRPGDTVRIKLNVRDADGKPRRAEASVWAVDEGVISLTDFQRPAMLAKLLAGAGDYALTSSTLIAWMLSMPPAVGPAYFDLGYGTSAGNNAMTVSLRGSSSALNQASIPAGFGGEAEAVRSVFATTPFFTGTVRTDDSGRATVAFKLPDNITTFRLYATAVGGDVFAGSGDTSIVSTRPLVVRAALPRIVRVGDSLYAGAVITQQDTSRSPVSLGVTTTTNITVLGAATVFDTLVAQRSSELRFPMTVTGGDSVTFVFRGTTSGSAASNDAVEARLPISPPGRARAHVVTGMIDRTERVSLAVPEGTDSLRSRVDLQLGVSAMPLVRQYSEALRIYPYYCTEQVSSAGRALLARVALQRALGDSTALTERDRTQLESAVTLLIGRQRRDGGFGYWSPATWSTAWLTGYALDFLLGAREAGIAVPASSLERGKDYLASAFPRQLRTGDDPFRAWRDSVAWPQNAMAVARMLRRVGAADTTLEADVWKMRRDLSFEDRLTLAALFAARADTAKTRELVDEAWRSARLEGRRVVVDDSVLSRRWLFRSTLRPIALLLSTTALLQPKHPLLGALFESVVQLGRSERSRWWNTLDQSAVVDALTAATGAMELSTARSVAVSGPRGHIANVVLQPARADTMRLDMASLTVREAQGSSLRLNLESASRAPTYFAMTLTEVPLARPVRADDAGIGVERWYESYDGGKPITEVREGELVRVRLRITAPADREFVVIDDALPAGLEAVDLSLRTSASLPPFEGAPRLVGDMSEGPVSQKWLYGSWDAGWWTPWEHKEIRDDRVLYFARQLWKGSYQASYIARATTAGTFVRPPAQAEEMYNPAVRGRSDGGMFTVTRAPK